jgi:hypothetical protein
MADLVEHKRGDTFDLSGAVDVTLDGQSVEDLTGWTARSQLRTPVGTLVAELDVVWLDASKRLLRLRKSASATLTWVLGEVLIDIELTSPAGDVVSTPTASLIVTRDNTHA